MTMLSDQTGCVLIVEDEFAIREALTEFLEEEGYDVLGAANGQEALEYLQHSNQYPSLILLDLMMPIMSGHQFLIEQQDNPRLADIPVVLLSAASDAHQHAPSPSVVGYLDKPVRLVSVLELVERFCHAGQP